MAATTAQPPLPMLPGDAVPVGPAAGLAEGDAGGVVFVHGSAAFSWDAGDEAGRRLAAVQLVRLKTAKAREVAAAFDVGSATLWRWDKTYTKHGVAGLVTARRGPARRS